MASLRFWNGNKSAIRQTYELQLLNKVLHAADCHVDVDDDRTDYPNAEDEGAVFTMGVDVCVTVAGNPKFKSGDYIPVYDPLMNGLLGHRLLVIRKDDQGLFAGIQTRENLEPFVAGIPETWADAPLFRSNGLTVREEGSFDDIFLRLRQGDCDYVSLGVNEIHDIFETQNLSEYDLVIERTLRLYYPFALVFYVHPDNPELANYLAEGLNHLKSSGTFRDLFQSFFDRQLRLATLSQRKEISLDNRALPQPLEGQMAMVSQQLR